MRPARPLAPLLLLVLAVVLGACSGGHSASAWASRVCQTLTPWRTQIASLTSRTQQQMTARTSPDQAKDTLMTLFGGAAEASDKARAGVAEAGVPDVPDGKQIAAGFVGSLSGMRDAYTRARTGVGALALAPAETFYDRVTQVVDQLDKDYQASSLDTSKLNSPELKKAFDELPECQ